MDYFRSETEQMYSYFAKEVGGNKNRAIKSFIRLKSNMFNKIGCAKKIFFFV